MKEVPGKVKISAYLMFLSAALTMCMACMLLGGIAAIPTMIDASTGGSQADAEAAQMSAQVVLAISSCFTFLYAVLYGVAGYGLLNVTGWGRILAAILSVLNLCNFPLGTIMGGFTLYVLFGDEESVQAFS